MSFFSTGSSGSCSIFFSSSANLGSSGMIKSLRLSTGRQRRLDAVEKQPGDQQSDPDDEVEQADQINGGQTADAFLPKFPEVRHHADAEKAQDEEQNAQNIGSGSDGFGRGNACGRVETQNEHDDERQRIADRKSVV